MTTEDTDKIAARLWDQCTDWNGAKLTDAEETRNTISCGEVRAILSERGRLRTRARDYLEALIALRTAYENIEIALPPEQGQKAVSAWAKAEHVITKHDGE